MIRSTTHTLQGREIEEYLGVVVPDASESAAAQFFRACEFMWCCAGSQFETLSRLVAALARFGMIAPAAAVAAVALMNDRLSMLHFPVM